MSGPLAAVFTEYLPQLLAKAKATKNALVGFAVTTGPEQGFWVVSLSERKCRRGTKTDQPDVVVEAAGPLLAALFAGALDVKKAVDEGALRVDGDPQALSTLVAAISA
jgi:hypothetical protein